MQGIIGKKIGMTRIFESESGSVVPVSIIKADVNVVQQIKTNENDGYSAVQLGYDIVPERKLNKALLGHIKKNGTQTTRLLKEFKRDDADENLQPGQTVGVESLEGTQYVDVTGLSKGRGFAGTIKQWNFMRGRETHGNTNRRSRGSLSSNTLPAHVFKGLRMAGRYGNEKVTIKGLKVVQIDKENGLLYIKGAVPGKTKGIVFVKKTNR